jgi:hypothetical protein
MVPVDSPETVLDLGAVFRSKVGIQHEGGLRLELLGNTNSALVQTDLSEAALTFTYARGKCGTATITVSATDGDGVSVQEAVVVMVGPQKLPGPGGVPHTPGLSMTTRTTPPR